MLLNLDTQLHFSAMTLTCHMGALPSTPYIYEPNCCLWARWVITSHSAQLKVFSDGVPLFLRPCEQRGSIMHRNSSDQYRPNSSTTTQPRNLQRGFEASWNGVVPVPGRNSACRFASLETAPKAQRCPPSQGIHCKSRAVCDSAVSSRFRRRRFLTRMSWIERVWGWIRCVSTLGKYQYQHAQPMRTGAHHESYVFVCATLLRCI